MENPFNNEKYSYTDSVNKYKKDSHSSDLVLVNRISNNDLISTRASTIKETDNTLSSNRKLNNIKCYKIISGRDVAKKIKSEFEDPSTYLNIEKELIISNIKGNFGPRYDNKNKIIPHSIVGSSSMFEIDIRKLKGTSKAFNKLTTLKPNIFPINQERRQSNVSSINNKEFFKIFEGIESRVQNNDVNDFMKSVPRDLKKSLYSQENILKFRIKRKQQISSLNKYICDKSKKENFELLSNQIESNNIKKEICDIVDAKTEKLNNNGENNW